MLYSLTLEIDHYCSYSRLSKSFPDLEINIWCRGTNDIVELKGDEELVKGSLDYIKSELGAIIRVYHEEENTQLVLKLCDCTQLPFLSIYEQFNCIEIPPMMFRDGREHTRLLVTSDDTSMLLEEMQRADPSVEVNIVNLIPLNKINHTFPFYLPMEEISKRLTEKQFQAIKLAYNNGYYEIPRAVIIENLAKQSNVHRKTFEEHLRKAENKILNILLPALILSQK
ncbi:MAG: helix-turn-helix domain-containing protein [Candidatus Thorarchaeota archaeon]